MDVAGKTGSLSGWTPGVHFEWFAGVAPVGSPRLALAALVVNDGRWKIKGSYVGKEAFNAYFGYPSSLPPVYAKARASRAWTRPHRTAGKGKPTVKAKSKKARKSRKAGKAVKARKRAPREDRGEGRRETPRRERFQLKDRRVAPRDRWNSTGVIGARHSLRAFSRRPVEMEKIKRSSRRRAGPPRAPIGSRGGSSW